jgi:TolB-like protein
MSRGQSVHAMESTYPLTIDRSVIDRELALIFASEYFVNAERMREFLEYVVTETLNGRANRIKSYAIAIEVFKRDADFDASHDPIVRTSANRLRAALERYNQNAVNTTGVQITLPKGRYVPVFTQLATGIEDVPDEGLEAVPMVAEPPLFKKEPSWFSAWAIGICAAVAVAFVSFYFLSNRSQNVRSQAPPVLIVTSVTADPNQPQAGKIAIGLSELLVSNLSAYGNSRVVDDRHGDVRLDEFLARESDVYVLKTGVRETDQSISIVWQLDDAKSKEVAWASEEKLQENISIDGAADILAGRVLGLEGALPTLMGSLYNETHDQLGCLSKPHRLAMFYHFDFQEDVKNCLEKVVSSQPNNAEAWAILAQIYYRLSYIAASFGEDTGQYDVKLKDAAMKAKDLSPNSILTKQALMYYAFNSKDVKTFEDISRVIIQEYKDPHLKMRIGSAFMNIGLLDEGSEILIEGIKEAGEDFSLGYITLAYRQYYIKDYQGALSLVRKAGVTDHYMVPLLKTVSLAKLGRLEEAKVALAELHALRPNYERNVYHDLRHGNVSEGIIDSVADGLALVGLDVSRPN